jgi:hypothetical protein
MKRQELLKILNSMGAIFVRHGGKHDVYFQPATNIETSVLGMMKLRNLPQKVLLIPFQIWRKNHNNNSPLTNRRFYGIILVEEKSHFPWKRFKPTMMGIINIALKKMVYIIYL